MIRVLVVDDSKFIQDVLKNILNSEPDIEVIDTASNGMEAINKILDLKPDVVTLDIIMHPTSGIAVLKRIMKKHPTPVVIFSGKTEEETSGSIEALRMGAVDFVAKPKGDSPIWMKAGLNKIKEELLSKIRIAATIDRDRLSALYDFYQSGTVYEEESPILQDGKIIAIGSSTGGPQALLNILPRIAGNMNASFIVTQHMPPFFIRSFAARIDRLSRMKARVASDGELLSRGTIFFAPGDTNIKLEKKDNIIKIVYTEETGRNYKRFPCIDVMMKSVAAIAGADSIGILLSGMGRDGSEGMKMIKEAGGQTIVQDQETSVVFGMPAEAIKLDIVDKILPVDKIAKMIMRLAG